MCCDTGPHVPGAKVQKGLEEAKQRCVREHDKRLYQTRDDDRRGQCGLKVACAWPLAGDDALVEMVQVCQAKYQRGDKGDVDGRGLVRVVSSQARTRWDDNYRPAPGGKARLPNS